MTMAAPLSNYRITPGMNDGSVIVRCARKCHACDGGHDGERRTLCHELIEKGQTYIEYVGESHPFQAGSRYHLKCAREQGLIERV